MTGFIVGVLGLPIRFVPAARRFWLANGEFTVFGALAGGILLILAYFPFGSWFTVPLEEYSFPTYQPNAWVFLVGWFLLAFSLSHVRLAGALAPGARRAWWTETQLPGETERPRSRRSEARSL